MKKIYKFIGCMLAVACAMSASAQQLPNVGFSNWKSACGSSDAITITSSASEMRQRPGVEPTDWNGSSVNQKMYVTINKELVFKLAAGGADGSACAQLKNLFVGVSSLGSVAPGFLTLGTPWVSVSTTVSKCDGGTYGGVAFTYKPDAVTGQFKRVDSNDESSVILVYLWNGTFKSKIGEAGAPKVERDNNDRAILGRNDATADPVTGDGKLVAMGEQYFKTTNGGWQEITVPINYVAGAGEPAMMNIVVSGGNYNDRSALQKNTELHVDDVKFLYYSRLSSLTVGGVAVDGFASDEYSYTVDAELPAADQIDGVVIGQSATKSVEIDAANAVVKVVVSNVGPDVDGASSHTYSIQFNKAETPDVPETPVYPSTEYPGYLNIAMMGSAIAENSAASIFITDKGDGTCDFLLPNLTLPDLGTIGDIALTGVTMTTGTDGITAYSGEQKAMPLLGGALKADVVLNGTITADGIANMKIDVLWLADPAAGIEQDMPIDVTFTTNKVEAALPSIEYPGYLNIAMNGSAIAENSAASIFITDKGDGTCDFLLPNLTLPDLGTIGDIALAGVTMTTGADGITAYSGEQKAMPLLGGALKADVVLSGTITADGIANMKIDVLWLADPAAGIEQDMPIDVTFTTDKVTGIEDVVVEENASAEYYNLQGVRVAKPENGLYIRVQGGKATKVLVK